MPWRILHSWTFGPQWLLWTSRKLHYRSFWQSWVPFPIFTSPEHCGPVNDDFAHIPALTTKSEITQEYFRNSPLLCSITVGVMKNERRSASVPLLLPPSVSEGTQCRNSYGDWEQLNTCSEDRVVEACTRDDSDGPGDLPCPNLLALTQDLLRKVWKSQREMDLEDEVFGKCISFFPNKTSSWVAFQDWEEDETI
jgi:hypothetical protein